MKLAKFFSAFFLSIVLVSFMGCASTTHETTGAYIDDSVVTTKVKAAILKDAGPADAAAIDVETFKGVVQLSGFVNSHADINKSVEAARGVKGVRSIKNNLRIKNAN